MQELLRVIMGRRSARAYNGLPIPQEQLESILLAGINAPSAHDSRPWHFSVFQTPKAKTALINAMAKRCKADLLAAGVPAEKARARVERSSKIFSGAPVLVVVFARRAVPANPLSKDAAVEEVMTCQSVALAAGQMLLAAEALGAAGCWFAAPLFCPDTVCNEAQLKREEWTPQGMLTLGYRCKAPKAKAMPKLRDSVSIL